MIIAIASHHIPKPQNINPKTKKDSFTFTNDEFLIKFNSARVPAPIGPNPIQIVGASTFGSGWYGGTPLV